MERVQLRRKRKTDDEGGYFVPLNKKAVCNQELQDQMVEYIEGMVPVQDACWLIGLWENTHYRWMNQGKEYLAAVDRGDKPDKKHARKAEYYAAINRALARFRKRIIDRSLEPDAMIPTWIRDMTILERRHREVWGRSQEVQLRQEEYDPDESFL